MRCLATTKTRLCCSESKHSVDRGNPSRLDHRHSFNKHPSPCNTCTLKNKLPGTPTGTGRTPNHPNISELKKTQYMSLLASISKALRGHREYLYRAERHEPPEVERLCLGLRLNHFLSGMSRQRPANKSVRLSNSQRAYNEECSRSRVVFRKQKRRYGHVRVAGRPTKGMRLSRINQAETISTEDTENPCHINKDNITPAHTP